MKQNKTTDARAKYSKIAKKVIEIVRKLEERRIKSTTKKDSIKQAKKNN
jgi:hypothetical protein